jgi:CheY-like chemotaxis protein
MAKGILVVDDSATVRKFASVSLSMQGFTITTACDGMDALEKLPRAKVDLVITDLNMPNMDGFELVRTLRESPATRDLPVIILTSLDDSGSRQRGLELGVQSYLMKPFSLEKIQYEVAKYLTWTDDDQDEAASI